MQPKTIKTSSSDDGKANNGPILFLNTTRKTGEHQCKCVKNEQNNEELPGDHLGEDKNQRRKAWQLGVAFSLMENGDGAVLLAESGGWVTGAKTAEMDRGQALELELELSVLRVSCKYTSLPGIMDSVS